MWLAYNLISQHNQEAKMAVSQKTANQTIRRIGNEWMKGPGVGTTMDSPNWQWPSKVLTISISGWQQQPNCYKLKKFNEKKKNNVILSIDLVENPFPIFWYSSQMSWEKYKILIIFHLSPNVLPGPPKMTTSTPRENVQAPFCHKPIFQPSFKLGCRECFQRTWNMWYFYFRNSED